MVDFEELITSIKEYTQEDINDPETIKAQISKILKTHRPIKLADYQYGFSCKGKKDQCLIVKEENDKTKVREYSKKKNYWYCSAKRQNCHAVLAKMSYGILFAPLNHSNKCNTKDYVFVLKVQGLLEEGKFRDVNSLIRLNDLISAYNASNQFLSTSMLDESAVSNTDMDNDSILHQSIADDTNDSHDSNIIPSGSEIATLSSVETGQEPSSSSVKRELDDTEYCIEIVQPLAKKPKTESTDAETFSFEYPSSDTLKDVCKKVNIEYDRNVYKFWSDIAFEKIVTVSDNIVTHSFKTPNIFACFSQFLTGKIDDCFDFQKAINKAFRKNLTDSGTKLSAEIDEICTSNVASVPHIEFIAKFLSCRIGIFESGNLKKYGKWESENSCALTLILSFENGFYSVVIDL